MSAFGVINVMSLVNKENDMTPFDMTEKPVKQFLPLVWLLWGASFIMTRNMSVEKIGRKGLKPPFLVLSTHQGFSDYFIAPRMLFPLRANYISDMEGFAAYGKLMYKHGGYIGKRSDYIHSKYISVIVSVLVVMMAAAIFDLIVFFCKRQ